MDWMPGNATPASVPAGVAQGGWDAACTMQKLEWVKSLLELVLLVLAIPWVAIRLLRDPMDGMRGLGESWFGG